MVSSDERSRHLGADAAELHHGGAKLGDHVRNRAFHGKHLADEIWRNRIAG